MMIALAGVLHAQQPADDAPPAPPAQPPAVEEPAQPQPPAPGADGQEGQLPPAPAAPGQQPAKPGAPAADDNVNLADKLIEKDFQEPTLTGDMIAELYREFTGKRVILTRAAMGKEISFFQRAPITYAKAADLLEKTALLEGLVFVPSGENEVKLIVAERATGGGLEVYNGKFGLPEGDQVITYVMTFEHISPEEAMKVFQTVVKQLSPTGSMTLVTNSPTLVITENTAVLRSLIDLKNQIDVPQEVLRKKVIKLENGDAEDVAEKVQSILDFTSKFAVNVEGGGNNVPAQGPSNNNNNRNSNNNRNANTGNESGILLMAMPRTNSIMINARPIDMTYAEGIIKDFDMPSSDQNYYKRKLQFIAVSEFLDIAKDAIQRTTNSVSDEGGGAGRTSGGSARNTQTSATTQGGGENGTTLSDSDRKEYPESELIGKTQLIADNANNTFLVKGSPQSMKIIDDLINEMDVASEQVQITAIFGRYNLNGNLDFGVDFARTYQSTRGADSGFAIGNSTGYPVLIDPTTLTDAAAFNTAAVSGLSIYGKIGEHFMPTLRALESTGRFKVLARPTVFTTNNKKAILSSGQSVAVPTNTLSQSVGGIGDNVSQSTNIEFKDILLKLEVVPLVNSENEVTLRISFINDTIVGSVNIDGNDIPTIGKEELVTQVTVPNKGTVVLGGLITERNSLNVSGVPILSRIPGVGKLFSSTSKEDVREELVIFIQPRIVNGAKSLADLQEYNRTQSRLAEELVPEAGLLPELPSYERADSKEVVPTAPVQRQPVKEVPGASRYRGLRR